MSRRVTLFAAPAGAGKSVLLADWVSRQARSRWGWLTLDAGDNDPARFWRGLVNGGEPTRGHASGLSVVELARHLGVTRNTLKSHLRHVYRKLGVASRAEALTRARDLGLR